MPDLLTLAPGVEVVRPDDGTRLRYSGDEVELVRNFFSLLVFGQNEWAGQPFVLSAWEEEAIRQFYGVQAQDEDGTWSRYRRYLYEEIPKKNGKSEFAAGLGLYHLIADGEARPQVGIFAADKTNADIIYQCAKYMVEHTALGQPEHDSLVWCRDSVREIRSRDGGVMKVYSSDASTKHGFSFSAIIIDELHAQPNRRLWDVLTAGSDAARRQQAVIVLTTAGDDPDRRSIGWEIHEKCRRLLAWRRGEPERELDSDLPEWCPIMFGIGVLTGDDPDRIDALDIYDEKLWYACNPGLGHNLRLSDFRREARAARQSEAAERLFRWLRLNQWIAVKAVSWVPVTIYDKTQFNRPEWAGMNVLARRRAVREYLRGKRCFGGLDLSKSTDLTALVLIFPPQEGLETWVALFWGWVPLDDLEARETRDGVPYGDWIRADFLQGCEGDIIDYDAVEQTIWQAAEEFDLVCLGLDPAMSWTLSQRLMQSTAEHEAIQVVEIRQNMTGMSPATKQLELLLRKGMMLHEHNTAARWCFGNVRCATDGNENMKPMKTRSVGRIDIAVAWIIAMAAAMLCDTEKPDLAAALGRADFTL